MEATPGIEIQGKRLCTSRSASNSQSVTQLELPGSRLSPAFPLSVHTVVPNSYQMLCSQNPFLRYRLPEESIVEQLEDDSFTRDTSRHHSHSC